LAREDAGLRTLISDLINRTAYYITIDPYANSFSPTKQHRTSREDLSLGRYDYVTTYNYEVCETVDLRLIQM
jgi:meiotically up-regulated gene 157 (Mug157) protein